MNLHLFRPSTPRIKTLTGHPYYTLVDNATSAIAVFASICNAEKIPFAVPALGCWAIAQAAIMGGISNVNYIEVDRNLKCLQESMSHPGCKIEYLPWFGQCDWRGRSDVIADLSVNCSRVEGIDETLATVTSFGPGKPAYWSKRGALITVRNTMLAQIFESVATLGLLNGATVWNYWSPRLTFVEADDAEVEEHLAWIDVVGNFRRSRAETLSEEIRKVCSSLEPVYKSYNGNSVLVPFLYTGSLSLERLFIVARQENLPFGFQPVSPGYMQPALSGLTSKSKEGDCPCAEMFSRQLCFVPVSAYHDLKNVRKLGRMLDLNDI